jgi:hypothetical protein
MTIDILRKTGGWCIELQQPLKRHGGDLTVIEIRKPTADIVIRWSSYGIVSVLALLSELCGLPEKTLRQLPSDDFDRVFFALLHTVPAVMKGEIEEGKRALATADEDLPPDQQVPPPDPIDPRFPVAAGPVVRLTERKPPAEEPPMNFAPPPVSEVIR